VKSVNVKRIAAVATGAAMLAGAFAGAVSVDEAGVSGFQFFSNGSPNVVLVVGSRAMPSDAVAAANVAAMIGNLAYTSGEAITVTGTDLLTCTGGAVSGATTTLKVETPGVNPALAYQIKTYVEDYMDDQADNVRGITRTLMSTFSSQSTTNVTVGGNPKTVTKDQTTILNVPNSGAIANPKGFNIKEEQKVYGSAYTTYDTGAHAIKGKNARFAYEAMFTDPLPLCLDTTKTQALCAASDLLTKNRVKISFLGDTWVLVPVSGNTWTTSTDGSQVTAIAMGKEVDYKSFMVPGDSTTLPDGKKVVLTDITGIGTGTSTQTRATFQVYSADGSILDQTTLYPLDTYDKNGVVIFPWDIVGGALGGTNYAEVSLFANRLVMNDGQKISGQGDWVVELQTQNVSTSQGLQKITLMDTTNIYNLASGDSVQMIKNIPGLKMTFNGFDLVADDYDTVQFGVNLNSSISLNSGETLSGDFLQISSQKSNAFYQSGRSDTSGVSNVYVLLNPASTSSNSNHTYNSTTVFYQNTSGVYATTGNGSVVDLSAATLATQAMTNTLVYYYSSTETGTLRFMDGFNGTGSTVLSNNAFVIAIPEGTEDSDTSSTAATNTGTSNPYWTFIYAQNNRQFVSDINSTTIGTNPFGYEANVAADATGDFLYGAYNNTGGVSFANVEANYVSYRGSVATSFGTSSIQLKYAKKIGHGTYVLSRADTSTTANSVQRDYSAGEIPLDDSGYKVSVVSVNSGGSADSTIGGVDSLAPSIETADSVVPLDTSSSPLVVLDTSPLATGSGSRISFGGQLVNSVSASALAGAEIIAGGEPIVKVVGSTIVVAGYDADGTTAAANSLIAWLEGHRTQVRG